MTVAGEAGARTKRRRARTRTEITSLEMLVNFLGALILDAFLIVMHYYSVLVLYMTLGSYMYIYV